jgi:hypothetical protein
LLLADWLWVPGQALGQSSVAREWSRISNVTKSLEQARTLAAFINDERDGRNYTVPAQVTKIEHLLCTPGPEFIWSRERTLWLNEEIPRICAPAEVMIAIRAAIESA